MRVQRGVISYSPWCFSVCVATEVAVVLFKSISNTHTFPPNFQTVLITVQRQHSDSAATLEPLWPRVVHWGGMKCRHRPSILQTHHELFPTHTGVMRCLAQPLRVGTTTKKASDSTTRPNRLHNHTHSPNRLAHPHSPIPPLSTLTARTALARPLHPTALASVPSGLY